MATHSKPLRFIQKFLDETDSGARLVGVWRAFVSLLAENGAIKVYSPNAPDFFAQTATEPPNFLSTETFLALVAPATVCSEPKSIGSTAQPMENACAVALGRVIPGFESGRVQWRWKKE